MTTPRLKPPRNSRNKIPLNEVFCIICGETGHWAKTCVNVHPKFKEAQAKREGASVVNACQLVDNLRLQVKHFKALSQANSAANSDADSDNESEGDWKKANGSTAAAVNRDRCFSCVSSSTAVSCVSLVLCLLLPLPLLSLLPNIFLWPKFLKCQTLHPVPLPNKIKRLNEQRKSHSCTNNRLRPIFPLKVVPFLCHASCPRNYAFMLVCSISFHKCSVYLVRNPC